MARDVRWLALLLLLAGGLRVALVELVFPLTPIGDERHYVDTATHLALGLGHRSNLRSASAATPPLYPYLLSHAVDPVRPPVDPADPAPRRHADRYVDATGLRPLLYVQAGMGTLLVGVTALLAGALFGRQAAAVAGITAAVYPSFLAYSHYLWSTLLFASLLAAALSAFWRARASERAGWSAAAGLLFGLAALTRETAIPVALVCTGLWLLCAAPAARARVAARGALLVAVLVATLAPWTLRNASVLGRLVPVSGIGWMALAEGNALSPSGLRVDAERVQRFRRAYFAIEDEAARNGFARSQAIGAIVAAQPAWLPRKLAINGTLLFRPDSFLFKKLERGSYGEVLPGLSRVLLLATVGSYAAVGSFAVIGIAAATPPVATLAIAVVGTVAALHVVANASSRYRLALMPLLIACAAHGLLCWRRGGVAFGRARRIACGATLALFWIVGIAGFARDFVSLWVVGRYAVSLS